VQKLFTPLYSVTVMYKLRHKSRLFRQMYKSKVYSTNGKVAPLKHMPYMEKVKLSHSLGV